MTYRRDMDVAARWDFLAPPALWGRRNAPMASGIPRCRDGAIGPSKAASFGAPFGRFVVARFLRRAGCFAPRVC